MSEWNPTESTPAKQVASPLLTRLAVLGFSSYEEYLTSPHWQNIKLTYPGIRRCKVCNSKGVHLHHRNYRNLGNEQPGDLVPLCKKHHDDVHQWLKESHLSVSGTRQAIEALKAGQPPQKSRKQKHWPIESHSMPDAEFDQLVKLTLRMARKKHKNTVRQANAYRRRKDAVRLQKLHDALRAEGY